MKRFLIGAALAMVIAGCGVETPEKVSPSKTPPTASKAAETPMLAPTATAAPAPEVAAESVLDMPPVEAAFLVALWERLPKLENAKVTTGELFSLGYAFCQQAGALKEFPDIPAEAINGYTSPVIFTPAEALTFIEVAEVKFCGKSDFFR